MEDALVHKWFKLIRSWINSLNPCFNGRCTSTAFGSANSYTLSFVLILVLMEDALVPYTTKARRMTNKSVLILVLMEDALVPFK